MENTNTGENGAEILNLITQWITPPTDTVTQRSSETFVITFERLAVFSWDFIIYVRKPLYPPLAACLST